MEEKIMKEELRLYLESLINDLPQYVYEGLMSAFCIGIILILVIKRKKGWRGIAGLLLTEYTFLIYCLTVFFRAVKDMREYDYTPLWSYKAIINGREELLAETIMNVVVFVPVGLLLGCAIKGWNWWKAMITGAGLSVSIELLQLVFKRGFSEVDDVIHNTLGCMIGYGIYSLVRVGYEKITKRNIGILWV